MKKPPRLQCPRCERPQTACICAWVRPVDNAVELLLLQHPLEQHEAKGTARLLRLSLARCELWVGEQFDAAALAAAMEGAALLYPPSTATASATSTAGAVVSWTDASTPSRLIVIDATWPKSRKMLALNPALLSLPRVLLTEDALPTSGYAALRRARQPQHRSTLEASVQALQQLEPRPERYAPLLAAFEGFVAEQLGRRDGLESGHGVPM